MISDFDSFLVLLHSIIFNNTVGTWITYYTSLSEQNDQDFELAWHITCTLE